MGLLRVIANEDFRGLRDCTREFLDNTFAMYVFDTETFAFLKVNEAAIRQYGYTREQFLSMTILDIRPAEDVIPILQQVMRNKNHQANREQWRHRKKDGTVIHVRITTRGVFFDGRDAKLVIAEDVTSGTPPHPGLG